MGIGSAYQWVHYENITIITNPPNVANVTWSSTYNPGIDHVATLITNHIGDLDIDVSIMGIDTGKAAMSGAVRPAPDNSTLTCTDSSVPGGLSTLCSIVAYKAGVEIATLSSAFVITATPHNVSQLRVARDGGISVGNMNSRWEFDFIASATVSASGAASISDGFSKRRVIVTQEPDHTTQIFCPSVVEIGGPVICTINPRRTSTRVFSMPWQFNPETQSGPGGSFSSVYAVGTTDQNQPTNTMYFTFWPPAESGPVTLRLRLIPVIPDQNAPPVTQWATTMVVVTELADNTSTIFCRGNHTQVTVGFPLTCFVQPKQAGNIIYARASRLKLITDGRGVVIEPLSPAGGNMFSFRLQASSAYQGINLQLVDAMDPAAPSGSMGAPSNNLPYAKSSVLQLQSTAPSGMMAWAQREYMDFAGPDTSTIFVAKSKSLSRSRLIATLARSGVEPIGQSNFFFPSRVTASLSSNSGARVKQISCSQNSCAGVTVEGDVLTWGNNQNNALGRAGDMMAAPLISNSPADFTLRFGYYPIIAVCVIDAENSNVASYALDSNGAMWRWGDWPTTVGVPSAQNFWFQTVLINHKGLYMLALTSDNEVMSWANDDAASTLGRPGAPSSPSKLPIDLTGLHIVALIAGKEYGIIVTDSYLFSWGNALWYSVLPSETSPVKYEPAPGSDPVYDSFQTDFIVAADGAYSSIALITQSGKLYTLRLGYDSNIIYPNKNPIRRIVQADSGMSLHNRIFVKVSVGNPVILASDLEGTVWQFREPVYSGELVDMQVFTDVAIGGVPYLPAPLLSISGTSPEALFSYFTTVSG